MALNYGVLRGHVETFKREDTVDTPHLQIKVVAGAAAWRVAVNVLSGDGSQLIFHKADPLQGHPVLAGLGAVAPGFTPLPAAGRSASTALDFFRAPLFDWPTGVAVPATGPGATDDLQDLLTTYLTLLKDQQGEIFVFGAGFPEPNTTFHPSPIDHDFDTHQGVHDIHTLIASWRW